MGERTWPTDVIEDENGDPVARNWVVEVSRLMTGRVELDAGGYGIHSAQAAAEFVHDAINDGLDVKWEGGYDRIDAVWPLRSPCRQQKHDWHCAVHGASFDTGRKHCWTKEQEVRARWSDRSWRLRRAAQEAWRRTHHTTTFDIGSKVLHARMCQNCDWRGLETEAKEHEWLPLPASAAANA